MFSIQCFMSGHDDVLARAPDRLSLQCLACGRRTPGWSVGASAAPGFAAHAQVVVS